MDEKFAPWVRGFSVKFYCTLPWSVEIICEDAPELPSFTSIWCITFISPRISCKIKILCSAELIDFLNIFPADEEEAFPSNCFKRIPTSHIAWCLLYTQSPYQLWIFCTSKVNRLRLCIGSLLNAVSTCIIVRQHFRFTIFPLAESCELLPVVPTDAVVVLGLIQRMIIDCSSCSSRPPIYNSFSMNGEVVSIPYKSTRLSALRRLGA